MIRNADIDRLRGLFAKRLIATMDMLKKTVGTVADLTVFRKLRELDYCTSYSHRGRFYTLRELAEFDENGLWWIRSVGFSSRGTLVATAEGLLNASEAGYAVEELDAIVRVGTKDVLPKLAWEKLHVASIQEWEIISATVLRDGINNGDLEGPRMFVAGHTIRIGTEGGRARVSASRAAARRCGGKFAWAPTSSKSMRPAAVDSRALTRMRRRCS